MVDGHLEGPVVFGRRVGDERAVDVLQDQIKTLELALRVPLAHVLVQLVDDLQGQLVAAGRSPVELLLDVQLQHCQL